MGQDRPCVPERPAVSMSNSIRFLGFAVLAWAGVRALGIALGPNSDALVLDAATQEATGPALPPLPETRFDPVEPVAPATKAMPPRCGGRLSLFTLRWLSAVVSPGSLWLRAASCLSVPGLHPGAAGRLSAEHAGGAPTRLHANRPGTAIHLDGRRARPRSLSLHTNGRVRPGSPGGAGHADIHRSAECAGL